MDLRKNAPLTTFFRRNGIALLLAVGLFALVYAIVYNFCTYSGNYVSDYEDKYFSDYLAHSIWAMALTPETILASFYNGSERLWHIFVKLLFSCGMTSIWAAAASVTAAADASAYFLVYKSFDTALSKKLPRWVFAILLFFVFFANALTLPGSTLYIGRGAFNVWHNPTNIMVRPFAAAVFFMTVRIYNRRRYGCHDVLATPPKDAQTFTFEGRFLHQFRQPVYTTAELVLYPVCLLLSAYSKPSFLQFFAPAIFIFLLIDVIRTRGMLLPFCIKLALSYIPVAFALFSQFFSFFGAVGIVSASTVESAGAAEALSSGIAIYFSQVSFAGFGEFLQVLWRAIWQSFQLCAFPLFILIIAGKRVISDTSFRLGFISMLVGRLEALFLHETGSRAAHGNFLWGYYLSAWVFWCASLGSYVQLSREKSTAGRLVRWGGTALLLWHLACGIVYAVKILQTGQYYF